MGNNSINEAQDEKTKEIRNKQFAEALIFNSVALVLLFASMWVKSFVEKRVVNERLTQIITCMPLIAFVVSMYLCDLSLPRRKSIKIALTVSMLALLMKINSGLFALLSACNVDVSVNDVLTKLSIIAILFSEACYNHCVSTMLERQSNKFRAAFLRCAVAEYASFVLFAGAVIVLGCVLHIEEGSGALPDVIFGIVVLVTVFVLFLFKVIIMVSAAKAFGLAAWGLFFKKVFVSLSFAAVILSLYMHAHQFCLKYVYDKAYNIWSYVYSGETYEGREDLTALRDVEIESRRGEYVEIRTLDELKAVNENGAKTYVNLNVNKNSIMYVGDELKTYGLYTDTEQNLFEELIHVGYKFPDKAIITQVYNATLDDGNIVPIVISNRMYDKLMESENDRVIIPCMEIVKNSQKKEYYINAVGYTADYYKDSELWIKCDPEGLMVLDIVYDYCLKTYAISRSVSFIAFFSIAIAFFIWYGLKDSK